MIYKPWHGNPLHPGADKGNALANEKQPVVPVFQGTEYCLYFPGYFKSALPDWFHFRKNLVAKLIALR